MVTAIGPRRPRADGLQQLRAAKGRHIALLLQLEALLADTARGIDGEHQLQVDRLRRCGLADPHPGRERQRECENCRAKFAHRAPEPCCLALLCPARPRFARDAYLRSDKATKTHADERGTATSARFPRAVTTYNT